MIYLIIILEAKFEGIFNTGSTVLKNYSKFRVAY